MDVKQLLRDLNVTVIQLADYFNVCRSTIYQSLDGNGSRYIRVHIATVVGVKPSELWVDNSAQKKMLDDSLYAFIKSQPTPENVLQKSYSASHYIPRVQGVFSHS